MEKILYAGRKCQLVQQTVMTANGQPHQRVFLRHPGAVLLLPFVDAKTICMVRNHRRAVGQWLLELPAGTLEPEEPPEATAQRELQEETGYLVRKLTLVRRFFPSPGLLSEVIHLYLAEDLVPGPAQLAEGEELESLLVPWDEAIAWVMDGTIQDGKTLFALLYWDRLRKQGRDELP